MANDLTTRVLASSWFAEPQGLYIFSRDPQEMVLDTEDDRLLDIHRDFKEVADVLRKSLPLNSQDMDGKLQKLLDYERNLFMARMRGFGAGLDQDRILQHIVDLQEDYVVRTTPRTRGPGGS